MDADLFWFEYSGRNKNENVTFSTLTMLCKIRLSATGGNLSVTTPEPDVHDLVSEYI